MTKVKSLYIKIKNKYVYVCSFSNGIEESKEWLKELESYFDFDGYEIKIKHERKD